MLRQLFINNLAIIESLDIEFKPGMTVLTGETGAGKSILLDALGLILGDRANSNIIRGDTDKTDITAIFSIDSSVFALLDDLNIEYDDELYIRRIINRDGRSQAYLNNTPVPVQALRQVGEYLVDIHGQHAHQSLSRTNTQRHLLDEYSDYHNLLDEVKTTYQEWRQIDEQLAKINAHGEDYEAHLTLLRYQIEELTEMDLSDNEYQELSEQHKRSANSQKLLNNCQQIFHDLFEQDTSINQRISQHNRAIEELSEIDPSLKNIGKLLDNINIEIEEVVSELKHYIDQFEYNDEQLAEIEKRLDKLHELSRKHKVKPELLKNHLDKLTLQLSQLEGGQEQLAALQKRQGELTTQYFDLAATLHKKRKSTAKTFSSAVTGKMHELGMGGKFEIEVEAIDDSTLRKTGQDRITFMVSTNPGQPLRPITKVASGGELSRLSLAIQIVGLKNHGALTMIFDEVDAGVSGSIAEIVGKMLNTLAQQRQILCVTHLAQVASCGQNHLKVTKTTKNDETFTQVTDLEKQDRVNEIARLLAGMKITAESRANATRMLETS